MTLLARPLESSLKGKRGVPRAPTIEELLTLRKASLHK